jgi:hypothetical protein
MGVVNDPNAVEGIPAAATEMVRLFDRCSELSKENVALRKLLKRYRTETPVGHQPHMIAHEVDRLLGQ